MDRKPPVLIVGAGPTGLVLALWLTKLGVPVRIVDRTAEPGTTSRAMGVAARTLELYRSVGLADAVIAGGVIVPGINFWVKGSRAARLRFEQMTVHTTPFPFILMFPQDAHERLLVERLHMLGVDVERQTELMHFEQRSDGVCATLRRGDGTQERCDASYLAGCDGARSTVRQALAIGFPGGTYAETFYVADTEVSGPAANGEINVDLEEADFLAVFPMKDAGRVRLIGTVQQGHEADPGQVTFEQVRGRAIEHLHFKIERVNWFSSYRVHHRVAERFRVGRAFLLGDAAHVHSPVGAQGMNTGIGDAVNLAWKLAAVLNAGAKESLLDTYEVERIAFARRLVATTDRIFTFVTKRGTMARLLRTRVAPVVVPLALRIGALRRLLFRIASQIGINYRMSPLSSGKAGKVRGGDRLPWVELNPGRDNFEPLASLAWQVHVYGEATQALVQECARLRLPLHAFAWTQAAQRAGLRRDGMYLIRPDGYLAMAHSVADAELLRGYFERSRRR